MPVLFYVYDCMTTLYVYHSLPVSSSFLFT